MDFLKEEGYVPSTQIGIFDKKQIIALMIACSASAILLIVMFFMDRSVNLLIFRVSVSFNLAVVVLRISNYIFVQKNFRADYALPFHLCSYKCILVRNSCVDIKSIFDGLYFFNVPVCGIICIALSRILGGKISASEFQIDRILYITYVIDHRSALSCVFLGLCTEYKILSVLRGNFCYLAFDGRYS